MPLPDQEDGVFGMTLATLILPTPTLLQSQHRRISTHALSGLWAPSFTKGVTTSDQGNRFFVIHTMRPKVVRIAAFEKSAYHLVLED